MSDQYVYFGFTPNMELMKVGISRNPWQRMKGLGVIGVDAVLGTYELEQRIHRDLEDYCVHGEWYRFHEANLYLKGFLRREGFPEDPELVAAAEEVADW